MLLIGVMRRLGKRDLNLGTQLGKCKRVRRLTLLTSIKKFDVVVSRTGGQKNHDNGIILEDSHIRTPQV